MYQYTVTCPQCGAKVQHPQVRLTPTGMVELCDQCGAVMTDEVPMITGGSYGVKLVSKEA